MSTDAHGSVELAAPEKATKADHASTEDGVASTTIIDPEKERRIIRKFDMLVLPQFVLMIILAYLDRTNIGNARIFGFEESLNLKGNDFSNLNSLFYVTYVVFEIPWVLAVKRFGANSVIAIAIVAWSAITIGTGFVHNYNEAVACRLVLGFAEAGVFPAITFLLATIYPRHSQGKRVAAIYGATAISGAFGGLIAYGIQRMGNRLGIDAWRWLFIIEGIISLVLGALCWLSLPKSAEHAWFLNAEEKQLIAERKAQDSQATATEDFSWKYVRMAFTDPLVWVAALSLFCAGIPLFGFGIFLPTIIRGMGFESLQVNYLTIPVYVAACIILGTVTYISDRLRKRAVVAVFVPLIVVTGYAIVIGTNSVGAGYFAMFLCSSVYTYNTMVLAWASNNIYPNNKRSVALPLILSIANLSGIAASQVYPNNTAPRFIMGNAVSLAMEFTGGCGIAIIWFILKRRNKAKAKQIAEGVTDNGRVDDKSLDFEYMF